MNNRRILFIVWFLLMTIPACVVPGFSPASEPAPSVEPGRLETMVAGTVSAAIALTEQSAPKATPPLTNTAEPVETAISTQEPAASGSSLTAQSDGTILHLDATARFQLNVSPGWLPVRINEQEYYDALSLPAASDAAVQRSLEDIKTLDPNTYRLFIYDLQDGHMQNGVITSVNFVWEPRGGISLDSDTDIKEAANTLSKSIPTLNVISSSVSSTTNGIPIGVILSEIPGKTLEGTGVVLFQKQVYLNLPAGELIISFTTGQDFKDATLPFFDTMLESLKINQ